MSNRTSEVMMEIADYHLANGCDTCDFFRNGNCERIPCFCVWMKLHKHFKEMEQKGAEE